RPDPGSRPAVILTTVNAVLQRVPSRTTIASQWFSAAPGNMLRMDDVMHWLELNGFLRGSTVREPGEYAVRGGILDLFAPGMEHWLPLFHERLETLFDYVPGASIVLEPLVDDAANERLTQIADYYEARKEPLDSAAPPYHPLPPDRLYLAEREWRGRLDDGAVARLTPFSQPDASSRTVEIGA